jgi:hypothetical protein
MGSRAACRSGGTAWRPARQGRQGSGSSGRPDDGTANLPTPGPDSSTPRPDGPSQCRNWFQRLEESSKAAVIGALAAVIVALITGFFTLVGTSSGTPSASPAPLPAAGDRYSPIAGLEPKISIDSWTENPGAASSSETYEFSGTVTNAPRGTVIVIVAQTGRPDPPYGSKWLVSPRADVLRSGRWKVSWTIKNPPAKWSAPVVLRGLTPASVPGVGR